jgi:hypothetical protein
MKYGSASEYAKVRRRADFKKAKAEALAEDERERDIDRVQRALDDFHERMAAFNKAEAERDAKRREEATAFTLQVNKRMALREWMAAGITPPSVDVDGYPLVSLSLYLTMGWTIGPGEHGENMLYPPPPQEDPRKRETQINEMGS